ncbi:probable serine/threonine-protein kinase DDB_G0282963 [Contarinia nasturtii]|uniref:probable serine/threonine-protein kinase DDB_G0282963 n=1 Tax=Contarinia nasturtii TaxID=265458 RepID=UPI0012D45A5A|nr:probable serine/threonine-protein kinase DDB_G0282963 [Contarinia nasturtii]
MAKLNSHEQLLSSEYGSTAINTNASAATVASASMLGVGCVSSSNSISTTFPSNHHLLVRHAAIEITPPAISHSQHQLNSGNSFELNGVTTSSLSEDSGLPLTTNSSISSGDSTRMGLCKFEFELATESDAEVSQFDSLENCSDGGMSAENFNTLKKVPLAPIDPPPEFQDSPQTTLLRSTALQSFSTKLAKNIVSTAITVGPNANSNYDEVPMNALIKTKSLEILPTTEIEREPSYAYDRLPRKRNDYVVDDDENQMYQCEYHLYHRTTDDFYHTYDIYASDSVLNTHIDNIYDVPCDEYAPANVSCDSILERSEHFSLFDDTQTKVCDVSNIKAPTNCVNRLHHMELANEIHDYDLYYQRKVKCSKNYDKNKMIVTEPYSSGASTLASNTINSMASANNSLRPSESSVATNHTDSQHQSKSSTLSSVSKTKTTSSSSTTTTSASITTFQHRKTPSILYSPLHYHANSNLSTGQRPNSRNSLNSRLSSSHNSLTISSSNKADDSIFITQAMSHDALTSREISDFYNVPIDSDIYALPIDVIRPIFSSTNTSRTCTSGRIQPATTGGCGSGNNTNGACKTGKNPLSDKSTLKSVASMQNAISSDIQLPASSRTSMLLKSGTKHFRGRLKYVRNNKRRKRQQSLDGANGAGAGNSVIPSKSCRSNNSGNGTVTATDKRHSVPENVIAEPIPKHVMLDEVKQQMMYTSLCSSSSESALELKAITKNMSNNFNSNCNHSSGRINKLALFGTFSSNKHSTNNNNNNNSTSFNHNNANNSIVILKSDRNFNLTHINNNNLNNNNTINNSIANSHTKLLSVATSTSSTPNHNANTANSKLPNARNTSSSSNTNITAATGTAKNAACNIKKINSSPSIAKESNNDGLTTNATNTAQTTSTKKSQFSISLNLKQKFCSIFRFRKSYSTHHSSNNGSNHRDMTDYEVATGVGGNDKKAKFSTRALPPLPPKFKGTTRTESPATNESSSAAEENVDDRDGKKNDVQTTMDFAANIEKVKEYGWYWGPISSEAAEKILSNEPDGSFIVRDSSDDHYIFSLTFKLNNCVRHVRIEQDQGTFSFGSCAKFKSRTIMEFIENAVESSRSGRYLFFFHRRPEHGPMRVQLTNPVSRFKHIQSLQHMCRFVIRRAVVRKDLIQTLPLPRRLLDYLSYKNCYSEQVESDSSQSPTPENNEENHSDEAEEHVILR